ncbi:glycine zipper family protein [Vibrio mexicanus]|uniref:glycine zipper family protein n=1 Tax=Vibrio mexicanus TaxID=1004326 RepID=UPI00063C8871|nr:glycine zipper family protein [Vibrio mexicanus]
MEAKNLKSKFINALALIGIVAFASLPTYAAAHSLVFDESPYDPSEFAVDHAQCYELLDQVGHHEGTGAAKTGAAIGTTVGVLSGAGSKNAASHQNQIERDEVMRNCMNGRGYSALN